MSRKKHTAEAIFPKLREAEVELARGEKLSAIVRKPGITEQTYYRWRKEYGGWKLEQARRLFETARTSPSRLRDLAGIVLYLLAGLAFIAILKPEDPTFIPAISVAFLGFLGLQNEARRLDLRLDALIKLLDLELQRPAQGHSQTGTT